jgi:hypothetical protein
MPSQLAEMALLVLASLGRFLRVSRLKDSSRDQRRATKLSLSLCNGNKREPFPTLSIHFFQILWTNRLTGSKILKDLKGQNF